MPIRKSGTLIVAVLLSLQNLVKSESQSNYVIPNFMANWHSAAEYCNILGLRLAVIDTSYKESQLIAAIGASGIFYEKKTPFWIGANDLANEGFFFWRPTGKRVIHSSWADNQPDNAGAGGEHCVEVGQFFPYSSQWQWNDRSCGVARFFACEKSRWSEE